MSDDADRKLFLGGRLKRLRRELALSQTAMAADLGVSPSYLNHIERNQRPVSAQLLLRLAETYDVDLRAFGGQTGPGGEAALAEVFADPLFQGIPIPRHEILQLAEDLPGAADAVVRLYRALSQGRPAAPAAETAGPADWVRDHIQARRNHFPELDLMGEALSHDLAPDPATLQTAGPEALIRERLKSRHDMGVRVMPAEVMVEWTRRFDPHRKRLLVSEVLSPASRAFALAYQLGLIEHGGELQALVDQAAPPDTASARLLKVSLANTLAAAILMPYGAVQTLAEQSGYDIDRLCARFGVSFEQAAHRLTTLSRPTARGVPFFFIRVDRAGNVSKRYASSAFPFARFGGGCPRWRLHDAFGSPGRVLTQIVETPDGERWFTLARTVPRQGTHDHDLAVGLGCELKHARRLIHARGLDLDAPEVTGIGPACRLCDRHPCPQRAEPPQGRPLTVDDWAKSVSPYPFVIS